MPKPLPAAVVVAVVVVPSVRPLHDRLVQAPPRRDHLVQAHPLHDHLDLIEARPTSVTMVAVGLSLCPCQ